MFHAVVTSWVCFHSPVLQSNSRVEQMFELVVAEDYREVSSLFRGEIEEYIAHSMVDNTSKGLLLPSKANRAYHRPRQLNFSRGMYGAQASCIMKNIYMVRVYKYT